MHEIDIPYLRQDRQGRERKGKIWSTVDKKERERKAMLREWQI